MRKVDCSGHRTAEDVREHYLPSEEAMAAVSAKPAPAPTSRKYRVSEDGRFCILVIIFLALAVIAYMIFGDKRKLKNYI